MSSTTSVSWPSDVFKRPQAVTNEQSIPQLQKCRIERASCGTSEPPMLLLVTNAAVAKASP